MIPPENKRRAAGRAVMMVLTALLLATVAVVAAPGASAEGWQIGSWYCNIDFCFKLPGSFGGGWW